MITCTIGQKRYTLDFVTGRAMREMGPAMQMYARVMRMSANAAAGKAEEDNLTIADAMDVMVKWFCVLFQNQFTPDELYDGYPADRIMHDIALALMAVQSQTTGILDTFPTKPTPKEK